MSLFVDLLACCSVVGIWPRFIEPRILKTTELNWELEAKNHHLRGIKIVHVTDLHFHSGVPQRFLDKILRRINGLKPDVILFTGDFLCYSQLEQKERLASFLSNLQAPLGCFCTFGNHDYAHYVSLNREGVYDLMRPPKPLSGIMKGLRTLFASTNVGTQVSEKARAVSLHSELTALLKKTPFMLLDNATTALSIGLNIAGLGDISVGRCRPEEAFAGYNSSFPGIVLSHNPDTLPHLLKYPGDWILCGHTHGEQIHIPWPKWGRKCSQKLARLHNSKYTRGLFTLENNKKLYVNRGLGGHKPFRFCSPPEICLIKGKG